MKLAVKKIYTKKWNVTPKGFIAEDIHVSLIMQENPNCIYFVLCANIFSIFPSDHNYSENLATEARLT